ncbi:MAG: chemotaxis protein CheW [Candidatus Latescibacterota bacterium]
MILILFHIGEETFGLEAARVIEVIPALAGRKVPHTPEYVAGVINFRGTVAPVIDLAMLHLGKPSLPFLSTRIILTGYAQGDGIRRIVGLLAARVTDTFPCRKEDLQPPGVRTDGTRYLGEIILDGERMIQLVTPERILSPEVMDILDSAKT